MAIFPLQSTIDSGADLKQAFAQMGRDTGNLPTAYYDALFEIIEEHASACDEKHHMLDVIAWGCDTTYTTLDDRYITPAMYADDEENPTTEELANYLQEHTSIIWQDETTVYHLVY